MKKALMLVGILSMMLLMFGCVVSSTMGAIQITNFGDVPFSNVKIGDKVVAAYLAKGASVQYPLFAALTGRLTCAGVEEYDDADGDPQEYTFKLNYGYVITIIMGDDTAFGEDGKYYFSILTGSAGTKIGDVDDPAD